MRAALRSSRRLDFVCLVSGMVAATESNRTTRSSHETGATLADVVDGLAGIDLAESTAALHALAALTTDELLATRIRRVLAGRRQPVPDQVRELDRVEVDATMFMGDELGDGDNVILPVRWPSGFRATVVVYIDHALGMRIKDAMVIDQPGDEVIDAYRRLISQAPEDGGSIEPLDRADARAIIEKALQSEDDSGLPPDEDAEYDWPAPRPLVRLLTRRLPSGGTLPTGPVAYPVVTPEEVVAHFLGSADAVALDRTHGSADVQAATALVGHAASWSGHALRWSPVTVEVALAGTLPWDPAISEEGLEAVPRVLPHLVRYSHRRLGISSRAHEQTMAAIPEQVAAFEDYRSLDAVREYREAQGDLAAMLAGDSRPYQRRQLRAALGSDEAVEQLDDTPLPDEELALDDVAEDIHDVVTAIDRLITRWTQDSVEAQGLGGEVVELRTACRRFLAKAAAGDPGVFRRRARADTTAAAVLWTVGRANQLFGYPPAPIRTKDLQTWFALTGMPSQRAESLQRAFGVPRAMVGVVLGTPDLLTSSYRGALLARRDA